MDHKYTIDLALTSDSQSKQAVQQLRQALSEAEGDVSKIGSAYKQIGNQLGDNTALAKEYESILNRQISAHEKEIESLLKELEANKDLTEEEQASLRAKTRGIDLENKALKTTRAQVKMEIAANKQKKLATSQLQKQLTIYQKMGKAMSKLTSYSSKMGRLVGGIGKGIAKFGAMFGAAGIIGGTAMKALNVGKEMEEKERALASLKGGIDPSTADAVYTRTGADYSSIVKAINRVHSLVKDKDLIVDYATLELQSPGAADLFLAQKNFDASNGAKMASAIAQIKRNTGAQDLSEAIKAVQKNTNVTRGAISQTDYLNAYATLQSMGLDEDSIDRAINAVVAKGGDFVETFNQTDFSKYGKDAQSRMKIKNGRMDLKAVDPDAPLERSISAAEQVRTLELEVNRLLVTLMPTVTKALQTITKVLQNPMVQKALNVIVTVVDKAFNWILGLPLWGKIESFIEAIPNWWSELIKMYIRLFDRIHEIKNSIVEFFTKDIPEFTANLIAKVMEMKDKLVEFVMSIPDKLKEFASSLAQQIGEAVSGMWSKVKDSVNPFNWFEDEPQKAQGGLVTTPSIVGEQGPELVLPLNNPGRSSNIINNFYTSNSFNTTPNPTELSLSQQLGSKRFARRAAGYGGF